MHAGIIQGIIPVKDPEKARTLLVSLRPQLWHLQKLGAVLKPSVLFPVIHNIFCNGLGNSRNIFQQGS